MKSVLGLTESHQFFLSSTHLSLWRTNILGKPTSQNFHRNLGLLFFRSLTRHRNLPKCRYVIFLLISFFLIYIFIIILWYPCWYKIIGLTSIWNYLFGEKKKNAHLHASPQTHHSSLNFPKKTNIHRLYMHHVYYFISFALFPLL